MTETKSKTLVVRVTCGIGNPPFNASPCVLRRKDNAGKETWEGSFQLETQARQETIHVVIECDGRKRVCQTFVSANESPSFIGIDYEAGGAENFSIIAWRIVDEEWGLRLTVEAVK